jgi:hypothetical protein
MPIGDVMFIIAIMLGLVVLRLGVPALLMWGLGRLLGVFAHPAV